MNGIKLNEDEISFSEMIYYIGSIYELFLNGLVI